MSDSRNDFDGIDPLTMNMNVKEYYEHLLIKYKNDRMMIAKHFLELGFIHTNYIGLQLKQSNEHFIQLSNLSESWKMNNIIKKSYSAHEFCNDKDLFDKFTSSIVVLKYQEKFGARYWKNKWAKEMRGTILFVNPESNFVRIISFKLPRGAEVVSGMIKRTGLNTQDVNEHNIDILDDEQQETCRLLCEDCDFENIKIDMTAKGDGSLLVVNSFENVSLKIMDPIVEIFGTEWILLWRSMSLELSNGKCLVIPSTQSTVMASDHMAPYLTTSILVGNNQIRREELTEFDKNYIEAWKKYGKKFIEKILEMKFKGMNTILEKSNISDCYTFCFEAICKKRMGLFGDEMHTELACSYERDRLLFLGITIVSKRFYIPHSIYSESKNPNYEIPFEEPLWWRIRNGRYVDLMIDSIEKIIRGELTKDEFLKQFPPENKNDLDDCILDFEGWVAMKHSSKSKQSTVISDDDHLEIIQKIGIPLTIYSKIKTESYYRSHNFHSKNIKYLQNIGKTAGHIFPMANRSLNMFTSEILEKRFRLIGEKLREIFDPKSNILVELNEKINEQMKEKKIKKNPMSGIDMRPDDVKWKIILNSPFFDISIIVSIYGEFFHELNKSSSNIGSMIKNLTQSLRPWENNYNQRIVNLSPTDDILIDFIGACF
jgi:hypothetical protein